MPRSHLAAMLCLLFAGAVIAAQPSSPKAETDAISTPQLINYQGKLTDSDGDPLTGTYDMAFAIYNVASGGSALWSESQADVVVTEGIFNVILGSVTPITGLPEGPDCYLGIAVETDPEIAPRTRLVSVPYAYHSDNTAKLQGSPVSATAPGSGQVLAWDGAAWAPAGDQVGTNYWSIGGGSLWLEPSMPGSGNSGVRVYRAGDANYNLYCVTNAVNQYGVYGYNVFSGGIGVYGVTNGADGYAVYGFDKTSGYSYGVLAPGYTAAGSRYIGVWGVTTAGTAGSYGVVGEGYTGVRGTATNASGYGVYGYYDANHYGYLGGGTYGTYGFATGSSQAGVYGCGYVATSGYNTYGVAGCAYSPNSQGNTYGLYGYGSSYYQNAYGSFDYGYCGYYGQSYGTYGYSYHPYTGSPSYGGYFYSNMGSSTYSYGYPTYGVYGYSQQVRPQGPNYGGFFGVYGGSSVYGAGYGVYGVFASATSYNNCGPMYGVYAYCRPSYNYSSYYTYGVYASSYNPYGNTYTFPIYTYNQNYGYIAFINAQGYKIYGTGAVSTYVLDEQGDARTLHCPETPEVLFEDVGSNRLVNGYCRVNIDPLLQRGIVIDEQNPLRVFVTPTDEVVTLAVRKGDTYFEVLGPAGSNVAFDWRLVANRSGFQNMRFEKRDLPEDLRGKPYKTPMEMEPNLQKTAYTQ